VAPNPAEGVAALCEKGVPDRRREDPRSFSVLPRWLSWGRCPRPTRHCPKIASIETVRPDRQVDEDPPTSGPSSSFVRRGGSCPRSPSWRFGSVAPSSASEGYSLWPGDSLLDGSGLLREASRQSLWSCSSEAWRHSPSRSLNWSRGQPEASRPEAARVGQGVERGDSRC